MAPQYRHREATAHPWYGSHPGTVESLPLLTRDVPSASQEKHPELHDLDASRNKRFLYYRMISYSISKISLMSSIFRGIT